MQRKTQRAASSVCRELLFTWLLLLSLTEPEYTLSEYDMQDFWACGTSFTGN